MKRIGAMAKRISEHGDMQLGDRLRAYREAAGLSRPNLAELIGSTFQQIEGYEEGADRLSAARLQKIANALGVPVAHLMDQVVVRDLQADRLNDFMRDVSAREIVEAWPRLPLDVRRKMSKLIRSVADRDVSPGR